MAVWWLRNPATRAHSARVLRTFGASIGEGVTIKRSVLLDNVTEDENSTGDFSHLRIGDRAYIGDGVYFDLAGEVTIGADAVIAGQTRFVTHFDTRSLMERKCAGIIVDAEGCTGFGATLLAGSRVQRASLLAAGAVLLQGAATEPMTVWAGVPARKIADITARTP